MKKTSLFVLMSGVVALSFSTATHASLGEHLACNAASGKAGGAKADKCFKILEESKSGEKHINFVTAYVKAHCPHSDDKNANHCYHLENFLAKHKKK